MQVVPSNPAPKAELAQDTKFWLLADQYFGIFTKMADAASSKTGHRDQPDLWFHTGNFAGHGSS
jgi:hypothetical protein